jgi:acetyl-CoA carboxylase biotin carboxylase subunit
VAAAARAAQRIGYVGAGTIELLLDAGGTLRFMEMNTRLQVEHSVTEMRSGLDLVAEQIRIAAGHPLPMRQGQVTLRGHAIECRINAEDPARGFRPAPGVITRWSPPPAAPDLRIDTHVESGYEVPPHYDSLLCKVIACGEDRAAAIERMIRALEALVCEGVPTTVPMHLAILRSPELRDGRYDNRTIPGWPPPAG